MYYCFGKNENRIKRYLSYENNLYKCIGIDICRNGECIGKRNIIGYDMF